ncbi:hypothetical protein ABZU32_16380 [Sphaerisporangium sp. NPDC005288]|uniref:hypothetical protein n=1 Tax=Sphaerisporangium sp. NPDC005288 TaxID=3155114 RepID=UPI0033BF3918
MDPGYIVVVIFGVSVVAAVLGVALVTIVLRGIRGEPVQWPVAPDGRARRREIETRRREGIESGEGAGPREGGEHPEWTGRDLAGDDLRPAGARDEKHALPGRARWW